jgi:heme-degrading monooxygenase HmoA
MDGTRNPGAIAVIFLSRRNADDPDGYAAAAEAMEQQAARQPGYLGIDSVRDAAGDGITISWWADEAAAHAWRAHAAHRPIQARGRSDWYDRYEVVVAEVTRSYAWARSQG